MSSNHSIFEGHDIQELLEDPNVKVGDTITLQYSNQDEVIYKVIDEDGNGTKGLETIEEISRYDKGGKRRTRRRNTRRRRTHKRRSHRKRRTHRRSRK